MKRAILFLTVAVLLAMVGVQTLVAAPAPQQAQNVCLISSPTNGSQVRGQVVVTGSATHPDFKWYQIGYAPDPNPTGEWRFFTSSETAVPSGRLGVWDSTIIPDGTYQLILEVHRNDGNNDHCFANQLRVNNTAPTPTFTAQALPTAAETPTPLASPTETATVFVEQPPTATPRATPTYSPLDNPTPTPQMTRFQLPIEPASVRNASCRGAQLTVAIAGVVALYFVLRGLLVGGVRRLRRPHDVEGFHTRRPREN